MTYQIKLTQANIDTMLARLTDGKGRASDKRGRCSYRNPKGLPCVVGAILPNDVAKMADEVEEGVFALHFAKIIAGSEDDLQLLHDMQNIHDWPDNWNSGSIHDGARARVTQIVVGHGFTGYAA